MHFAMGVGSRTIQVDVTNILIKGADVTGMSLTSINHDRQSAALLQTPDIHSKLIL